MDLWPKPIRFSTKYQDNESDLLYYGYRYLNTTIGKWLSRDPIEEKGGKNLSGFVKNNPILLFDLCGMDPCGSCGWDITKSLERTLLIAELDFWAADTYTKLSACDALLKNPRSWDIYPLYFIGTGGRWSDWSTGTGPCDRTLSFKDRCVWAGSANYAFYGKACKACYEASKLYPLLWGPGYQASFTLEAAIDRAKAWKWINGDLDSTRARQAVEFVKYGYGVPYTLRGLGCDANKTSVPDRTLAWHWAPLVD